MFSKDSENFRKKNKSKRNGGLETARASLTELQYTAKLLFGNRSKTSQKNMKL